MRVKYIVISAIVAFSITSCSDNSGSGSDRIPPVKTCIISRVDDSSRLTFPGKVVSDDRAYTAFKVAGRIASIKVREGDFVKKGQMIGTLDDSDYRIALDAVEAEYNSINSEAQRIIALYNENATTKIAYDKAVYGLQQIEAKLQHARNQLSDTYLVAPTSGIVKSVLRHPGEVVGAGMTVVEIVDNDTPLVEVNIPASSFANIDTFNEFYCTFDAWPGRKFPLKIYSEQSVANANQLYNVKFSFTDKETTIPSLGMSATVTMLGSDTNVNATNYTVPSTALAGSDNSSHIFIVEKDSTLTMIPVAIEKILRDGMVEISSASSLDNALIVAAGAGKLHDNMKVRPLAPPSSTNVGNQL